jgi:hypothetical protein
MGCLYAVKIYQKKRSDAMAVKVKSKSKGNLSKSDSLKAARSKEADPKAAAKAEKEAAKAAAAAEKQAAKDAKAKEKADAKDAKDAKNADIIKAKDPLTMDGKVMTEEQKREFAVSEDKRFRGLEYSYRHTQVEMMIILREFQAADLWQYVDNVKGKKFSSFDKWLREAAPVSRASAYASLKAGEKLLPYIPKEELESMSVRNINILSKVPRVKFEKVDSPIRKAAQGSEKDLRDAVDKHAPEAHIEHNQKFTVEGTAAPIIRDALEAVKLLCEVHEDGEALEILAVDWLDALCQDERFPKMNNRDAVEALKKQLEFEVDEQGGESLPEGEAVA